MILGHMAGKPGKWRGVKGLFDGQISDKVAVRRFLSACQRKPPRLLVRLTDQRHVSVFAPSGAGKNVSIVEPFLLDSIENCICLDIKGENARITAQHRARAFSHQIFLIDPFHVVTKTPSTFNVIQFIDANNPASFDEIRAIASAITLKEPNSRDPHWQQKAELFITGVISAVIHFCPPEHRSLQEVASIMADKALLKDAIQSLQKSSAHSGLLARLGNEMSISTDKELDGILSTANRSLTFLSTPAVVESTKAIDGFNPSALSDSNVTVYLILPPQYMMSHSGLMRLWVTALMRSVVSRGVINPRPVNVILDECASLGPLQAVEEMLSIGRGFGLRIIAIFQSMSQLKKVFPEGQEGVLLSNTTQIFFGVHDQQEADYVSTRCGERTDIIKSGGSGDGRSYQSSPEGKNSSSYSTNNSSNWQQHGRKLLTAAEVTTLPKRVAITFMPGMPPLCTHLIRYYDFKPDKPMGLWRSAFDTACLILWALMTAVLSTGVLYQKMR